MFSFRTTPFLEQDDKVLSDGRLAVLCNQAAWHPDAGEYLFEILQRRGNLVRIFMPEHSFYGPVSDSLEAVEVSSAINMSDLADIDALVIELQDVGSRYSDFTSLLLNLVSGLKESGSDMAVYILDRPCPSGRQIEGTMGSIGLPQRHGLTFGELAYMFYCESNARFPLHIISFSAEQAPKRLMAWTIPPFSDFAGLFTSHFYSGQCLWMGTNVSYGHGTTRPFEQFGAPFMEPLYDYCARNGFSGWNDPANPASDSNIYMRWTRFVPAYGIYASRVCFGFQMMFIPGVDYHALNHALRLVRFVHDECPDFEFDGMDALIDDEALMCYMKGEVDWDAASGYIKAEEQKWLRKSKKFLLYDETTWRVK